VPPIPANPTACVATPLLYPVNNVSCTHSPKRNLSTGNKTITANHPPNVFNHHTFCNFLGQLQGNFYDDGQDDGILQIFVLGNGDKQHGIVRPVCSAGVDRFIYDEKSRFTLCSIDGDVEAVMLKGRSSIQSLTW